MLHTLRPLDQYIGPVGLPLITSRITIEGNGATIARQGNAPAFGLIFVKGNLRCRRTPHPRRSDASECDSERRITVGGLSNNGTASIKNSIISGNRVAAPFRFGVSNGGTLTIENSVIQ